MLAIGLPNEMRGVRLWTLPVVDQIVVSVGPYMFQSVTPRAISSLARSTESASPPQSNFKPFTSCQPISTSICHVAGVACITVAPELASFSRNCKPSAAVSPAAITRRAPVVKGRKISRPAMSNESVVTASSTSSAVIPGSRCTDEMKFVRAQCSI